MQHLKIKIGWMAIDSALKPEEELNFISQNFSGYFFKPFQRFKNLSAEFVALRCSLYSVYTVWGNYICPFFNESIFSLEKMDSSKNCAGILSSHGTFMPLMSRFPAGVTPSLSRNKIMVFLTFFDN
jgi:hypothetical protein